MAFFLRPFTLQASPSLGTVVFTAGGAHSITSVPMQAVLESMVDRQHSVLDEAAVEAMLSDQGIDWHAGVSFLANTVGLLVSTPFHPAASWRASERQCRFALKAPWG